MIIVIYLVVGLIFAFICSGMARKRGRSPGLWGILGFFFAVIPVILLMVIGKSANAVPAQQATYAVADSRFDEIGKLKALLDQGALSEEEFQQQKRRILG